MMFIDAKGRRIEIEGDLDIEASHNGQRIGRIEFDDDDGGIFLWGMAVDATYQKAGIGTEMMRLAAEIHGRRFRKPSFDAVGGSRASSDSYYTQEGAKLIARCIREGILEDTEPREFDHDEDVE